MVNWRPEELREVFVEGCIQKIRELGKRCEDTETEAKKNTVAVDVALSFWAVVSESWITVCLGENQYSSGGRIGQCLVPQRSLLILSLGNRWRSALKE